MYSVWEKEIIWDPDNMDEIPQPRGLTLDLNDDNIVYEIPEDKVVLLMLECDTSINVCACTLLVLI